jgi:hypothetical protein
VTTRHWVDTVPISADVKTDPGTAWVTVVAVILMLFLMGWVGELFNNTLEGNYDRILAWWRRTLPARLLGALPWRRGERG